MVVAFSLLDRLHEAHCCSETNGQAHGYSRMDEVARDWIGEVLDRPATRKRLMAAMDGRYNPTDDVIAAVKAVLGVDP